MPELDFTIRTNAELAGAEQAAEALERLIGKQKALGEDYSENAARLEKIKGSLDGYKKTVDAGGESVSYFNVHGREMNRLFMEADRILPGLGEVLRAAFRPETLGIAATVLLVQEIVKWIGEAKKAADDLRAAEDKLTTDTWDNQEKAAGAAATAAQEYANKIGAIRTALEGLKTEQDRQKAILDAQIAQENALTEAVKKRSLALIESNAALSPEQKSAAAAQMNAAFDAGKSATDLKHEKQRIDLQEQAYVKAIDLWQPAAGAADAAEKAYQDALTNPAAAAMPAQKTFFEGQLPGAKKAMDAANARFNSDFSALSDADKARISSGKPVTDAEDAEAVATRGVHLKQLQAEKTAAESATENYQRLDGLIKGAVKAMEDHSRAAEQLKQKAESAAKNFADIDKATTDFYNAIETARKVLQIHTDTAAQLAPITAATQAAATSASIQKDDISPAVKAADAITAGKKVTPEAGAQLVALAELVTNHAQTISSAAQILETAKHSPAQMQVLLDRILTIINGMSGGLVGFEDRLAQIERQVASLDTRTGMGH